MDEEKGIQNSKLSNITLASQKCLKEIGIGEQGKKTYQSIAPNGRLTGDTRQNEKA